jgi:ubiquinone/menaquinone biosynthesis C-methylase UbiE
MLGWISEESGLRTQTAFRCSPRFPKTRMQEHRFIFSNRAASYVLGRSEREYDRLMFQARILRPYTEKYFRMAGLASGMRVLDLGSGMGDVALLAAEIVGPHGAVLGLDRDPAALERARERATEHGYSSWVSFQETDLESFSSSQQFDAIVGRFVLVYQRDAATTIRRMMRFLRPGGIVIFHEMDFSDPHPSWPPCELWDQVVGTVAEAFRRSGARPDFGRHLGKVYLDAELGFPTIVGDVLIAGGRGSPLYQWVANTFVSISPRFADLGLSLPTGVVADASLAERLQEAAVIACSQVMGVTQFGAWAQKPV